MKNRMKAAVERQVDKVLASRLAPLKERIVELESELSDESGRVSELEREFRHEMHSRESEIQDAGYRLDELETNSNPSDMKDTMESFVYSLSDGLRAAADAADEAYTEL